MKPGYDFDISMVLDDILADFTTCFRENVLGYRAAAFVIINDVYIIGSSQNLLWYNLQNDVWQDLGANATIANPNYLLRIVNNTVRIDIASHDIMESFCVFDPDNHVWMPVGDVHHLEGFGHIMLNISNMVFVHYNWPQFHRCIPTMTYRYDSDHYEWTTDGMGRRPGYNEVMCYCTEYDPYLT